MIFTAENKGILSNILGLITYKKVDKPKDFYIPEPSELKEDYSKSTPAQEKKDTPEQITRDLKSNIAFIKSSFNAPENKDIVIRQFVIAGKHKAFLAFLEGMVNSTIINDFILRPLLKNPKVSDPSGRCHLDSILQEVIETNQANKVTNPDELIYEILSGNTALYVEGCDYFITTETKGFAKRSVGNPLIEGAVSGSQEAFNETLRTNITLIRKNIKNCNLTTEILKVGSRSQIQCAIIYIKDVTNPAIVSEVKRRISGIKTEYISGAGILDEYIGDNPKCIFPTILSTERPDKTVSHIMEGRVAILTDGVPFASIVPVTITSFVHSPEDSYFRWPFGTAVRLLRLLAIISAFFLPGLYVAITNFHQEMIPTELLIATATAKENVPFPTLLEVVLMELSFELIREAGIRIPGMIGNTLGIVGALILGQAAVQANIVSPILIIVVAVTGLSNFAIPNFTFAFAIRILRFMFIFMGALLGFYGMTILGIMVIAHFVSIKSFGVNYFAPIGPVTANTQDILMRPPLWEEEFRPDYLNTLDNTRQPEISKTWMDEDPEYSHKRRKRSDRRRKIRP